MAYTSMVFTVAANANRPDNSPSKAKEHSQGSFGQRTSISNKEFNEISGE